MTDDLKLIVNEVNSTLKTEYNLISFDSMSMESLLQTLVDVLDFFKATNKFEVKFAERDEVVKKILESLKKIQYRPSQIDTVDPAAFRRNLSQGDKKTIYPIMKYVFNNKERIHHLTYLAQFLLPIQLPPEAMSNSEIATLWEDYLQVMEEFKEAHKAHTEASKETAQLKELRNDINAIEMEKDNVKKRIERTQTRLDKIPQQELLLEAAHVLRVEKDRLKELQGHVEDQKHTLNRAQMMHDRLQKELSNARVATQSTSPQQLMDTIHEETQVMEFMVKQKLPKEIRELQQETRLLEEVIDEPNVTKDYLDEFQQQVDAISKDVQHLIEKRLAQRGSQNDALLPFRQQAATVARNKEMAAEQLNQAAKELREIDFILQQKQKLLEETVGEVILRGEERKQYVNTLRAKTSVYKQQRAELASIRAELADLTQTLENLKSQDPTLSTALQQVTDEEADLETPRSESPIETRGLTELARIVDGLLRAVKAARDRVTPLSQKIRPLRERVIELKDERDSRKQTYDSINTTLSAEAAVLHSEIVETEMSIKQLEKEWQELKVEYDRAENLLERVRNEMNDRTEAGEMSVKESLQMQIHDQEIRLKDLQEEREKLFKSQEYRAKQLAMWNDVKKLLKIKMTCMKEAKAKGPGGTLSIDKNSETFTLQ